MALLVKPQRKKARRRESALSNDWPYLGRSRTLTASAIDYFLRAIFRPVLRAVRATFRPVLRAVRAVLRAALFTIAIVVLPFWVIRG